MSRLAKIGLFFLIIGVGGIGYILVSGDILARRDTYIVDVLLDDASGLTTNSQVQVAGVTVGYVRSIALENGKARLQLAISRDVELYEDAEVFKQPSSLLGTSVIQVNPGTPVGSRVEEGGRIERSVTRGDIGQTMDMVDELGGELAALVRDLRSELFTERVYGDMGEIVENVRYTSDVTRVLMERNLETLSDMLQSMERIVNRVEGRSDEELARVTRILESTATMVERVDGMLANYDQDLDASIEAVRRSAETLSGTMETIALSATDISDITGTVRRGEGTVGRALYDDELYERVNRIAAGAEGIVDDIVGLSIQFGYEGAYLARQEAARNQFSLRLSPRQRDRYYELGVVDTPKGPSRTTTTETVRTGDEPEEFTITETETTDGVRFNAQIARRLGPFTLRGGLIESSGGFGVDFQPLDQVMLSGEMFEFGDDDMPNLRAGASFFPFYDPDSVKPWEWIYFTGGVDRALDEDERQLFLGGGLRFTDDSLRGLFGLAPFAGAAQ